MSNFSITQKTPITHSSRKLELQAQLYTQKASQKKAA
jgi:hypothetical protein